MADFERVKTPSEAINVLDLEPIKVRLIDTAEGPGWSLDKADKVGEMYRAFLYLRQKYVDQLIVPTKDVDQFWHQHILDTQKYMDDCQTVFGHYLHHFPYFGLRGEDDAKNLRSAFSQTVQLFQKEFPGLAKKDSPSSKSAFLEALCIGEDWEKLTEKVNTPGTYALCVGEDWPKVSGESSKDSRLIRPVPNRGK